MTDLKIHTARAISSDVFYLAMHAYDEENPNSLILHYDSAQVEPWSRSDIPTNVNALCAIGPAAVAALGNEGEVFLFEGGKEPTKEIIKGAGLDVPHAEGRGYMMDMANLDGELYAVGYNQQLFEQTHHGRWKLLKADAFNEDAGSGALHFYIIDGSGQKDIYVFGECIPKRDVKKRAKELRALHAAKKSGDEARIAEARAVYFAPLPEKVGQAFHWDGIEWEAVGVPEVVIEACFIESAKKVWIGTADGLLLMGNAEDGFDEVGETDEGIVTICKFGERYIIGTRDSLVEFTPNEESFHGETKPIKPNLGKKKGAPLPLSVQAFGDELVYVDYNHGVYIWDGKNTWTHIEIPDEIFSKIYGN